jgi:LysM repeat protein
MKRYLFLFSLLFMMLFLTACETRSSQNNQFAGSDQDIVALRNNVAVLKRQIAQSRTNHERIMKHISSLQSQINYMNEQNQEQNKTIQQQSKTMTALQRQIEKERAERQAALDKVVETVASQTAKAVNSIVKQGRQKPQVTSGIMPAGAYYKHKVESGETLSAIARAYKVSVHDIKKTNNLKSNIIGVGQILHIPKK